jgi:hypothetical protein
MPRQLWCLSNASFQLRGPPLSILRECWFILGRNLFRRGASEAGSEIAAYVLQADWTVDDSALRIDLVH